MLTDAVDRSGLYALGPQQALDALQSDLESGLDAEQVARRQQRFGPNRISRKRRRSLLQILADQFRSVIVWLLSAAALLSLAVGDYPEALAVLCVLIINTTIGFITSWRAVRSMESLYRLIAVTVRVRREGRSALLPVHVLTPGDIVLLESGDIVPADLRLLEASNLFCDESSLTGESIPVKKSTEPLSPDTYVGDRQNMAFKGVPVVRGTGVGVVASIGDETELGRIATMAETAQGHAHPLERRLDKLGQVLVWITLCLSALIGLAGYLRGFGLIEMTETAIALAVAAVPEGLPVVATLALARGMLRLAQTNTLIEKLSAVETLGSTTVILTDKTGTLTENRMHVSGILLSDGRDLEIPEGEEALACRDDLVLRRVLEIGALCNNAEIETTSARTERRDVGDPMERALLRVAHRYGVRPELETDDRRRVAEHAFDPEHNMMATVHRTNSGYLIAVKGAPESVLGHAGQIQTNNGPLEITDATRQALLDRVERMAQKGYRIIGLASKQGKSEQDDPYEALMLSGFVCLSDPLREDIPEVISQCRNAGVRVVMMTGDHIATASEIALQAGLSDNSKIAAFTESDLDDLDPEDPDQEKAVELLRANVFARVSPASKLKLVQLYQNAGHVVAMTGDGVNDAPALKKADIGIAMGIRGTQVARDAAVMVLKDDSFYSIITAMRQGRVIYGNIRRFVVYLMSCNFSEILIVGLAIVIGLPVPLSPIQILFLNLVTDVFPAFALGLGEGDDAVMRQSPRDPKEQIVTRKKWLDIVAFGFLITGPTLGAYLVSLRFFEYSDDVSKTIAFLTLALCQLWHVFNMQDTEESWFANSVLKNTYVWAALGLCLTIIWAAFTLPVLSGVMALFQLDVQQLSLCLGASFVPLVLGQIWTKSTKLWAARSVHQVMGAVRR